MKLSSKNNFQEQLEDIPVVSAVAKLYTLTCTDVESNIRIYKLWTSYVQQLKSKTKLDKLTLENEKFHLDSTLISTSLPSLQQTPKVCYHRAYEHDSFSPQVF